MNRCVFVCMCVSLSLFLSVVAVAVAGCRGCCVLWLLWWRRERREETNRTMSQLLPAAVSFRIAETEQLGMIEGESATCCSRPILKLKMGKIHWFIWWTSGAK